MTGLAGSLCAVGLIGLLTQRNVIKQVIGLKIMLQGVTLGLILAGRAIGQQTLAEAMVASALVVEAVIIAIAIALIVNIFESYPDGDVDRLDRLRG
jgi:NADH:ubiquinone oxidoreductase subunit K